MRRRSILPAHKSMAALLAALRYVVLDEAHMYHGAFGVHVAMVLRRLRRLAAHYGAHPQFLCCSATMAEPASHMAQLTALAPEAFAVVSQDGSPAAEKTFLLWNPPLRRQGWATLRGVPLARLAHWGCSA